jgi:hypothetical protein
MQALKRMHARSTNTLLRIHEFSRTRASACVMPAPFLAKRQPRSFMSSSQLASTLPERSTALLMQ